MKSFGRIGYEQFHEEAESFEEAQAHNWMFIDQTIRDGWDAAAKAIIEEYERRRDDEQQQGKII